MEYDVDGPAGPVVAWADEGVRQGFLDDAVDGQLHAAAECGEVAHGAVGDVQSRGADAGQEGVQVAGAGLRAERLLAVLFLAQDAQDAP
ncbi:MULTISPECIES: hypothetical protein [Streptomyces violaceusniger group]|uniref:Uncharacterized protein n=1 Tax=Streptomyces rhizosphaericus TaxID=114699 RepID=A0ABN1SQF1_9ACTN|nr:MULTISPECIES: hypothetical protein [Streptomyces violaceusniger group]